MFSLIALIIRLVARRNDGTAHIASAIGSFETVIEKLNKGIDLNIAENNRLAEEINKRHARQFILIQDTGRARNVVEKIESLIK